MYVNAYAVIVGLIGALFIVTKMRHPHIKRVRQSLEGSILFKAINALDFYTGNHALFCDELFPEFSSNETPWKDPFHSPEPSICSRIHPSPDVADSHFLLKKSPGTGAYQILPALCATVGVFLFSIAIYLRKNIRLAVRENQRNVVIHAVQVERRVSQDINSVILASNAKESKDALLPSSSVSVATRRDDPIFYTNAEPVVVAPPMPVAISNFPIWTNSLPEPSPMLLKNRASDPVTSCVADSSPPLSLSIMPSVIEALSAQTDNDLPYTIPLPQDEPQPVATQASPSMRVFEPPGPVKPDAAAIPYFSSLPFAHDLDTQRSASATPASILSPESGARSPRNTLHITAPVSTLQVSCRRPEWLTSAQYWEAHSRLNALVSNTAAGFKTASDATRIGAPVISPAHVDSPSPYKISVPRACASISPAQPTTVSGSASHWDHMALPVDAPTETPFVAGRTGADLVLAMSTSMPRVIDLGVRPTGGKQWDDGGDWEGGSRRISPRAEMSISPRASSILRQVAAAAQASPTVSSRRRRSAVTAAVVQTQTPWLNRSGGQNSGVGAPATATRSTGVSPVQTAVQRSVMRRVLGPQRNAGRPSERWTAPADHVERRPLRITRIFGEPTG